MNSHSLLSEIIQNPIPFGAGFLAGVLQLDLTQDPLKSWLEQQGYTTSAPTSPSGSTSGVRSIPID